MMPRAIYFLVVLLVIGILCSGSVNPVGNVQTVKKVTTITMTGAPIHPQLVTTATPPPWILVNIDSVPADANVTVDGTPTFYNTPELVRLAPGKHTIVIVKPGYHSYPTTVSLVLGMEEQYITAKLEGSISPLAAQTQNTGLLQVTGVRTFTTTLAATDGSLPLSPGGQLGATTTAPVRTIDCLSNWTCMPLSEAEKTFGVPYRLSGDAPCGYLTRGSENVTEYCCQKSSIYGDLTGASTAPSTRNVSVINRTLAQMENYTLVLPVTPAATRILSQTGPLDSLFGLVLGLFGQCSGAQHMCNGKCVFTGNDFSNCGYCGHMCGKDEICENSQCLNYQTDKNNCGGYGNVCPGYFQCCSGVCTDVAYSQTHCGSCTYSCGMSDNDACCYGQCMHIFDDNYNCGGCGHKCKIGGEDGGDAIWGYCWAFECHY